MTVKKYLPAHDQKYPTSLVSLPARLFKGTVLSPVFSYSHYLSCPALASFFLPLLESLLAPTGLCH